MTDPLDPRLARRDVLRVLGTSAAGLALAGCGTLARPAPVSAAPPPPVAPTRRAEIVGPTAAPTAEVRPMETAAARPLVRPNRLSPGSTIALIAPAGALRSTDQVDRATEALTALGFRVRVGRHALARFGFLAGTDAERAADVMWAMTAPGIDAAVCLRGGWGCQRILPLLDYDAIRAAARPLVGYSDVTSLLLAVYARAGLVGFHGPVGVSTWRGTTADVFQRVLVRGEAVVFGDDLGPGEPGLDGEASAVRGAGSVSGGLAREVVRGGTATGPLLGGNLSVVSAMAGSGFLPSFAGSVAFFEEVGEESYRLDRMLTQLAQAGVLGRTAALAFGQCTRCSDGGSGRTAADVLREHLARERGPAWLGAPIGHVTPVFTLPVGLPVRADADRGTIEMLGPAVA